jgi:hypothetical protein
MGKNVGSNPRQRSRKPRHASSPLWHPRDFSVSSPACTGSAGGRTVPRRLGFLTITIRALPVHVDYGLGEGRANNGQQAGH